MIVCLLSYVNLAGGGFGIFENFSKRIDTESNHADDVEGESEKHVLNVNRDSFLE